MSLNLEALRRRVNRIDAALIRLLRQRGRTALTIGRLKQRGPGMEFYAPERERIILDQLTRTNHDPFPQESIRSIFWEIISASRNLQKPIRIAYFGPAATFTHQAAIRNFGHAADYVPVRSISDVFDEVEKRRVDYGVVPIENSTEGVVNHTLDMFIESDLKICAEILMEISHHLLSRATDLRQVARIYSHPQALAQSRKWIKDNLPDAEMLEVASTSEAAARAKRSTRAAAIASALAGSLYGLRTLASGIQDQADNLTRFYVIGHRIPPPSGRDKTSLMFSVKDHVGALHEALGSFRRVGINLTKIESRPSKRRAWEYFFFADFDGHVAQPRVRRVLRALERHCLLLRVLGSYPRAVDPR